jgi:HPt (histidine-containing phosphotransfer) domain-containing protein
MNQISVIDLSTFEALKDAMGADFMTELVQTYFDETPQLFSKLQDALANQDCDGFRRAAHSIKSTSISFGALELGRLAKELEFLGRDSNLTDAPEKVKNLETRYGSVQQALKELVNV